MMNKRADFLILVFGLLLAFCVFSATAYANIVLKVLAGAMALAYALLRVTPALEGHEAVAEAFRGVDYLLIMLGVVSVLCYFFFSAEHKGVLGGVSRVGIIFLMVAFGASFGYTVMSRISLLIGRVEFLLRDWLHLIG